jgi:hypothetical protein
MWSINVQYCFRWHTNIFKPAFFFFFVLTKDGIFQDVPVPNLGLDTNYSVFFLTFLQLTRQKPRQYLDLTTTTSNLALSKSPVTNQTAAVFGNIANCPISVKNLHYILVLTTLPDIFSKVLKLRSSFLYAVIINNYGKSPTSVVGALTQKPGLSIHWQVTNQFLETQATVDVNNFHFLSFNRIVCTWQSICPE